VRAAVVGAGFGARGTTVYTLEKRNHPKTGDPMLVLNGQPFVTYYKHAPMHGFWIALARRAGDSWLHPAWWPYWDSGIPFESTYTPLVPALAATWSAIRGVPHALAFQSVTGLVYCLAPLTLFLMAWLLTRAEPL
jgi:hypothetical protein